MDGDFFIAAALASTLTKMALRYIEKVNDIPKHNKISSEIMLILSSILYLGKSGLPLKPITNDDMDRIYLCLKVLSERTPNIVNIFNDECRAALKTMLKAKSEEEAVVQKVCSYRKYSILSFNL